jgi:chromosome segregation ATPase
MGALNISSQDDAERLERRVRVLSDRLEETEDRLDRALDELRDLRREVREGGLGEADPALRKKARPKKKSSGPGSGH